ncbi:uncharacterized protein RCC_01734 [Ramularia collo-cygni]|uniref:F-box domain-containing protein n=1 Tax=Ramularia collo-cygni TaxID=112498 RepID=A0A2D3UR33_9PEZI|nr:uncharacterized protein RCC_01734 [Ramularia collo-cygni]CZT15895.1 uncharacterized protein RCC_01734 [Ramularia collo-cygni]
MRDVPIAHQSHQVFEEVPYTESKDSKSASSNAQENESDPHPEDYKRLTFTSGPILQRSRLCKLPAEMKNAIYRFVLIEQDLIHVTASGYSRNGGCILATCKEIRVEALGIYYDENKFLHFISKFDSTPLVRFETAINLFYQVRGM